MGLGDFAALGGESKVLFRRQVLTREEDHLVLDESSTDLVHRRRVELLAEVHATDLSAGCARQGCDGQLDACCNRSHVDVLPVVDRRPKLTRPIVGYQMDFVKYWIRDAVGTG